ncbi:MAG: hypothetical protein ACI8ZB_001168 [Desulforhopalus sp.]|jgi:hypothetical protein
MKNTIFLVMYLFTFLFFYPPTVSSNSAKNLETEPHTIDIKVDKIKLKNIIPLIAQQTGYTILLDPELSDVLVSGNYSDISVEYFFQRVFKKKNLTFEFDSTSNILIINSFIGARLSSEATTIENTYPAKLDSQEDMDNIVEQQYISKMPQDGKNDIEKELSLAYINNLNKEQAKEKKDLDADATTLVGLDMTLTELDILNSDQKNNK